MHCPQTVLFCASQSLLAAERARVYSTREEQHVLLVDEKRVVGGMVVRSGSATGDKNRLTGT